MRISKDQSSWRARGILHRDNRHELGSDETRYPKGKKRKARKKIDHKHDWVRDEPADFQWTAAQRALWLIDFGYDPKENPSPNRYIAFFCCVRGCTARRHQKNLRYGYEWAVWKRKTRRR